VNRGRWCGPSPGRCSHALRAPGRGNGPHPQATTQGRESYEHNHQTQAKTACPVARQKRTATVRPLGRTPRRIRQRRVILAQRRATAACSSSTASRTRSRISGSSRTCRRRTTGECAADVRDVPRRPGTRTLPAVTAEDLDDPNLGHGICSAWPQDSSLSDPAGHIYRLGEQESEHGLWELRWTRSVQPSREERFEAVALRHVVARLKDYEPARSMTAAGSSSSRLWRFGCRLTGELDRLLASRLC